MLVKKIVNELLTSNTYLISEQRYDDIWLVDIGDIRGVIDLLSNNNVVKGVFITHSHYDHICGINQLIDIFPHCIIYTSIYGKLGLSSAKLNLSFYHENPIEYVGANIHILNENDKVELYDNTFLEVVETPGHNWGSLSFIINDYLFTGDSFIPNVDVVTKLKGGDKEASKRSIHKIMKLIKKDTIICPGHGEMEKYHQ